jgi:peptidyl-prolyl cis-trans isomerase C
MPILARTLPALLLGSALVGTAHTAESTDAQTLVMVDDFPVTNIHFALFASQTGRNPADAAGQISLLNELVNHFMVANSEEGQALAAQPDVVAALQVARARLIAQTFIRQQLEESPVDEAELRERYDQQYSGPGKTEFKARHILLTTEAEARDAIAELDGGADFAELATARSTGPSKTVGGDLGWFEGDQMVEAFSTATAALEDGSYSREPVKTQFGWHVILREGSREQPRPAFDEVRANLEQEVQRERIAAVINAIRDRTKIEVVEPDG